MNLLKRVHGVILPLGLYVSGMGLFGRVKRAQKHDLPRHFDLGLILSVARKSSSHDAGSTVASDAPLVLAIFGGRHISKIAEPIVVNDAINVVDVALRPSPVDVEPCEPMLSVLPPEQTDDAVSLGLMDISGAGSSFRQLVSRNQSGEYASLGVVVQKLFQSLLRKCIFGLSHAIAPHQRCVGQGLGGVGSTLMPRSIIGGAA